MESVLVSGIAYDKDQARVTLVHVKDHPGVSAAVFGAIARKKILVDMIVQNAGKDGTTLHAYLIESDIHYIEVELAR